jgi:hypothetical protein
LYLIVLSYSFNWIGLIYKSVGFYSSGYRKVFTGRWNILIGRVEIDNC